MHSNVHKIGIESNIPINLIIRPYVTCLILRGLIYKVQQIFMTITLTELNIW